MLTVGSLCSGYEGIGLGLSAAGIEHRTAFVADPDRGASAVLAARLPGVPNLGDITVVDWRAVMPVDLLTAGYPCQPFSMAGKRKGTKDVRHLWPHIADAVRVVRPRYVLLENVAGHRSLGFGRVLADLAAVGYVGSWRSVRASDVGAAHKRERVFILADQVEHLLPTPRASDAEKGGPNQRGSKGDLMLSSAVQPERWGQFAPAVRRQELSFGCPAPEPTEPGRTGQRLSPRFVEWLMGVPAGWVTGAYLPDTDPRPVHLSRVQTLRLLGNGVVPQQLAHALTLLARIGVPA